MALKDRIPFGMSLPHRSPEAIDVQAVRDVAQRAEALGFRDLWVTENTLDHVTCFDPVVVLTYAAAVTSRIRLGASVVVLAIHSPLLVAHQWATLDHAQQRARDPWCWTGAGTPLSAIRGARSGARAPLPRGGRNDPRAVDAAEGGLPRAVLPFGGRHDVAQTGAIAVADLDGRRPSERGAPSGIDRRWLDGVGRIEHRRVRPLGTAAARGAGAGGARPGDVPDLETHLHGGGRAAGGGARGAASLVLSTCTTIRRAPTRRVSTAHRNRCARSWRRWSRWAPTICC